MLCYFSYSVDGRPWRLFTHFAGAISGSSDFRALLARLLHSLGVVEDTSIPRSAESCSQMTCNALCGQETRPIVVFIDAVNLVNEGSV